MKTPIGGNKWSHSITRKIRERLALARRQRRAPDGRFEDALGQVRRDMIQGDNIQELMRLDAPYQGKPELITAEGCAVEA
jgi:hypothetical protein